MRGSTCPWPLSRRGNEWHPVRTLQDLPTAWGHKATDVAVRGFQQALHADIPSVTVNDIDGPVTWRALVSVMLRLTDSRRTGAEPRHVAATTSGKRP